MDNQFDLSPRLQRLADWVATGARVVDVGTDHAYLPVWLLVQGRVDFAIASDLRAGPLERARETGGRYGVKEGISYRLFPGLEGVEPHEVDTVVIAGMGGETMVQILRQAPWTKQAGMTLLLQPMSKSESLRAFLAQEGYAIVQEELVVDRGVVYPVMAVHPGTMDLTPGQCHGGVHLTKDPLGNTYFIERIVRLQQIIYGKRQNPADPQRLYLQEAVAGLMALREEWRRVHNSRN